MHNISKKYLTENTTLPYDVIDIICNYLPRYVLYINKHYGSYDKIINKLKKNKIYNNFEITSSNHPSFASLIPIIKCRDTGKIYIGVDMKKLNDNIFFSS